MRSMVEGAHVATSSNYPAKHAIHIPEDIARRNTQYVETLFPHQCITRLIATRSIAEAVSLAVDLDDQSMAQAGKIRCDSIARELAPEFQAAGTLPQRLPE